MAYSLRLLAVTLLLFSLTNSAVTAVEEDEVDSMLQIMRATGYNLFGNAIATSDLIYEVLTGKSFTFFVPTDSSLFTLDMTNTASDYISTLRCHAIPFRVTFPELRRFNSGTSLPTLFKDHRATVRVERRSSRTSSDDVITVDGERVVLPGLFSSRNIAVHGLRGILNCTSDQESQTASPPANRGSHSSVKNHRHVYPPPSNLSPQTDSQGFRDVDSPKATSPSPAVTENQAETSPSNFFNQIEPPTSGDSSVTFPEPEPPVSRGFSPANSPESVHFPPQFSPAYDLWLEAPTSPPEFSENDDPMAFPPATIYPGEYQGAHMVATESELSSLNDNELSLINKDHLKNAVSDYTPVLSTEDRAGIIKAEPEKSQPLDEATFDCPVRDGWI
ncbi:hypothetical protein ACH5RR_001953 [Cinchona calisaya]|uniref:FAS1 domain-containing protein n=1 Tax=Cinchona calisaya TaxID=153742 RepID=A0ABD3B659_9GENT